MSKRFSFSPQLKDIRGGNQTELIGDAHNEIMNSSGSYCAPPVSSCSSSFFPFLFSHPPTPPASKTNSVLTNGPNSRRNSKPSPNYFEFLHPWKWSLLALPGTQKWDDIV